MNAVFQLPSIEDVAPRVSNTLRFPVLVAALLALAVMAGDIGSSVGADESDG